MAMEFDGSLVLIAKKILSWNGSSAVSCRCRANSVNNGAQVIYSEAVSASDIQVVLNIEADGRLRFGIYNGSSWAFLYSGALSAATWYHVVALQSASGMQLYVDSSLVASNAFTGQTGSTVIATAFGAAGSSSFSAYMYGALDDMRTYNRALSAAEIQTIHACNGHDGIVYGLVGRWLMDECEPGFAAGGAVVKDLSGSGNTGTKYGSPALVTAGLNHGNFALQLGYTGGTPQYVDVTGISVIGGTQTIMSWVQGYTNSPVYPGETQFLFDTQSGRLVCAFWRPGPNIGFFDGAWHDLGNAGIWSGARHHVAFVFDADASLCTAYVDAVALGTAAYTAKNIDGATSIGAGDDGVANIAETALDDVRIYSRALSAAEISAIHTGQGNDHITTGLVGRWLFGERIKDHSGQGNHGTPYGGPVYAASALSLGRRYL